MKYSLVVDSVCELTDELKQKMAAVSVPLSINFETYSLIDDENLDPADLVKKMKENKGKLSSACPAPEAFTEAINNSEGENVFLITVSGKLSGSFNSARLAVEDSKKPAHVFDSKSASAGQILIAYKIMDCVNEGMDFAQIIKTVDEFIENMCTFFVLDDCSNFVKTGRIGKLLGTLVMAIRMKLVLSGDNGSIKMHLKTLGGLDRAMKKLAETISENCKDTTGKRLVITHCFNEAQAEKLKKNAEEKFKFKEIIIAPTGGVSSMYANNGGVIISFIK